MISVAHTLCLLGHAAFAFDSLKHPHGTHGHWAHVEGGSAVTTAATDPAYVTHLTGAELAHLRRAFGPGFTGDNLARLAGALPGATVTLAKLDDAHAIVEVFGGQYATERIIDLRGAHKQIANEGFSVLKEEDRGQGIGTRVLMTQVAEARQWGFAAITTVASGTAGAQTNGYYTWPRLGYDGNLSDLKRERLPAPFRDAHTLHELFAMPGGPQAWREHGGPVVCSFSLAADSRSLALLREYARRRGLDSTVHLADGDDDVLGLADETILEAIWQCIQRDGWDWLAQTVFAAPDPDDHQALVDAIDAAAALTDREPTEAKAKAGNYRKGKVCLHRMDIAIENPRGSFRSGTSKDGKKWRTRMGHHYGYILRTESEADGDHVDVFIGPHPESKTVFIVNQVKPDGSFDEHKCLLGFRTAAEARDGYLACYAPGWQGLGSMAAMPLDEFRTWAMTGDTAKPAGPVLDAADFAAAEQPRDAHGRWAAGDGAIDFGEPLTSAKYRAAPRNKVSDQRGRAVADALRRQGRLNDDGTLSLYHDTVDDPDAVASIMHHGLVPAAQAAPGQQWEAELSRHSTYFHQDKVAARGLGADKDEGITTIEARVPINRHLLERLLADEDNQGKVTDGIADLVNGNGALAIVGGVPAKYLRVAETASPAAPPPVPAKHATSVRTKLTAQDRFWVKAYERNGMAHPDAVAAALKLRTRPPTADFAFDPTKHPHGEHGHWAQADGASLLPDLLAVATRRLTTPAERLELARRVVAAPASVANRVARALKVGALMPLTSAEAGKRVADWLADHTELGDPAEVTGLAVPLGSGAPSLGVHVVRGAGADAVIARVFGRPVTDDALARMAGAGQGDVVTVTPAEFSPRQTLEVEVQARTHHLLRRLRRDQDGKVVMENASFALEAGVPRGSGIGTRVLVNQVAQAAALGVDRVEAECTGDAHQPEDYNGQWTWARLGFDGPMPAQTRRRLREAGRTDLVDAPTVQELLARPGGMDAWRAHGVTFDGTFSLQADSRSLQLLRAYQAERARRGVVALSGTATPADEDDAALDAVWARIAAEGWGWLERAAFAWDPAKHPHGERGHWASGTASPTAAPPSAARPCERDYAANDVRAAPPAGVTAAPPEVRRAGEQWAASLTTGERRHVAEYTGTDCYELNRLVRRCPETLDCLDPKNRALYDGVALALAKAPPLPQPLTVWRRVGLPLRDQHAAFMTAAKVALQSGQPLTLPGFQSCTFHPTIIPAGPSSVVLEIRARTGAYVAPISEVPWEEEFLQPAGRRYRVLDIQPTAPFALTGGKRKNFLVIRLEELPDPPPAKATTFAWDAAKHPHGKHGHWANQAVVPNSDGLDMLRPQLADEAPRGLGLSDTAKQLQFNALYQATKDWHASLTKEERGVVWAYNDTSNALNIALRRCPETADCLSPEQAAMHHALQGVVARAPRVDPPVTVYRGLQLTGDQAQHLLTAAQTVAAQGGELTLAGYQSTSVDAIQALEFTGRASAVVLEIKAHTLAYLGDLSSRSHEKENLLPHQSRFRVIKVLPDRVFRPDLGVFQQRATVIQMEEVLTPAAFDWDAAKHPRGRGGRFGAGGANEPAVAEATPVTAMPDAVSLTPAILQTLAGVDDRAAHAFADAAPALAEISSRTVADVSERLRALWDKAEVTMLLDPSMRVPNSPSERYGFGTPYADLKTVADRLAEEPRLKNLYEVGHGHGETDHKVRRHWEDRTFPECDAQHVVDSDRPKYAALNLQPELALPRDADAYGPAVLVLRKEAVADRLTLTAGNSSDTRACDVGTTTHPENALCRNLNALSLVMPEMTTHAVAALGRNAPVRKWAAHLRGEEPRYTGTVIHGDEGCHTGYVEAQLWGPLSLDKRFVSEVRLPHAQALPSDASAQARKSAQALANFERWVRARGIAVTYYDAEGENYDHAHPPGDVARTPHPGS